MRIMGIGTSRIHAINTRKGMGCLIFGIIKRLRLKASLS
jgi:hypothetical protein